MEEDPAAEELFSQLVSALSVGVRAVQGLPIDDEHEFQSSFPEFRELSNENKNVLLETLLLTLEEYNMSSGSGESDSSALNFGSLDDPLLWEACADACDMLLEQAESHLRSDVPSNLKAYADTARQHATSSFGRLIEGLVDMEKPQVVHQLPVDNDRETPFVPPISEKPHAMTPLDLTLRPGHGLDTRFGELRGATALPLKLVAPAGHVAHCYETEIRNFAYTPSQLEAPSSKPPPISKQDLLNATWVDTPEGLNALGEELESSSVQEIALDLEAHSFRSFGGIVCLIQLSFKNSSTGSQRNFLIDPFPVWNLISSVLGPVLANPSIVKVLHGADSDIQWLQRDFGLYVVNLFDTGRASRALKFPSAGYAYLLKHYVGVDADKTHQLADWRQRPLPDAMRHYAIMDTHYLLDIYNHLKYDLYLHKEASIEQVLDTSRQVCLVRYAKEPFKPDGYRSIMNRRRTKTDLNDAQEAALRRLFDWRDQTARNCDESLHYVCSNDSLLRLALSRPTNLSTLQGMFNPMPPLLLRNSKDVLRIIQQCGGNPKTPHKPTVGAPSSAFFKPANAREERLRSPVLGTEALYRQAGWTTPQPKQGHGIDHDGQVADIVTTTGDDEDADETEGKPRRALSLHATNDKFRSTKLSTHNLSLRDSEAPTRVADGLGPVRVSGARPASADKESELAQNAAARIHLEQKDQMMSLINPTNLDEDEDEDIGGDDQEDQKEFDHGSQEFVIPRSMREIYRISNRNRRNKKAGSPLPERAGTPADERERAALAKADEILKSRGLDGKSYFEDMPASPKRQRTKSTGASSHSSEEAAGGHDSASLSREDDIALMQEIGWIKDREEAEGMIKQRHENDGDDGQDQGDRESDEEETRDTRGKSPKPGFDYSSVGQIGVFNRNSPAPANPFFSGAALAGGQLNQQQNKNEKKKSAGSKSKQSRRQTERPEKKDGRTQAFKKR